MADDIVQLIRSISGHKLVHTILNEERFFFFLYSVDKIICQSPMV